MIVFLDTVIAYLAVDGPQWTINAALNAIFLVGVEPVTDHHILVLRQVHVVD
jgi:hypothetical protein